MPRTSPARRLIATLIGIAIIVGAGALGTKLNSVFKGISTKLTAP